ncbi:MAG: SDR family NAD(P)-dependent oxidoreductase [Myxococcota bacterium]|nr:SDR family NAD(P)-dependent oxidoreductase [Myxococcota bacterium]
MSQHDVTAQTMAEKTVVITGANRGLGRAVAKTLASRGAQVVLACRSRELGEAARAELSAQTGVPLEAHTVDLADFASVRAFAAELKQTHRKLDVLVHNAGVSLVGKQIAPCGVEAVLATNVLGPQLLTSLLVDPLRAARPARVINVASTFAGQLDLDDLQFERRPYNGTVAYKQSKQALRMLTREWARHLEGECVTVNAMAPGLMPTDIFRHQRLHTGVLMRALGVLLGGSIARGAETVVWLATSGEVANITGRFFERKRAIPCAFVNEVAERALFEKCEALINPTASSSR